MGIDIIDLIYRIEKQFGVEFDRDALKAVAQQRDPVDFTVGEIHKLIVMMCHQQDIPIEDEDLGWSRLQRIISDCLGIETWEAGADALMIQDLGME